MIVVHCDRCGINYDIADVRNETTHPAARHVARFDCPRGHRGEARRMLYQPSIRFEAGRPGGPSPAGEPGRHIPARLRCASTRNVTVIFP
jgi:hypothetical protein